MYLPFTPDHETIMTCVFVEREEKTWGREFDNNPSCWCVGVCQCMCVVFLCVTVFISHLCVTVYCGISVDHLCVVKIFKLTNKTFVTKMFLSGVMLEKKSPSLNKSCSWIIVMPYLILCVLVLKWYKFCPLPSCRRQQKSSVWIV